MRSIFMGSPEFALAALTALADLSEIVGVVTQPDRPAGRGRTLVPPPVKIQAEKLGLACIQPETMRSPEVMDRLRSWNPDVIVVAAFGKILRPDVLSLPKLGCLNLHASLLPRHRGAAPIPAAILAGDAETGITLMKMDEGLDTGPILAQKKIAIRAEDTAGSLSRNLADLGAEILRTFFPVYIREGLIAVPQDESRATYAPQLRKEQGLLDFQAASEQLSRKVRAFQPWPGTFVLWKGQPLKILEVQPEAYQGGQAPGTVLEHGRFPAVRTADGIAVLRIIQPAGKRAMPGDEFLRGARDFIGQVLA
ncbi:MAG: methionyl-tRNA formyltransferase [Anaerolineales bacterium]|nr:methionyl-tRNA formyltransferase [Anaerolineales bacterium]